MLVCLVRTILFLLLTAFGIAACTPTTTAPSVNFAAADSVVAAAINEQLVPGAVLLVSVEGIPTLHNAYGLAEPLDVTHASPAPPQPTTPDHVFDLASVTKVLATTLSIMLLVDENKVVLDEPVRTYLPEFTGSSKDSVTVRHLLTHTSGLFQWKPIYYHARNAAEARAYISNLELGFPVGKERRYSDLGFMLLGYIVETVSGKTMDSFVSQRIYQPLGLEHTGFNLGSQDGRLFAATSFGNPFEKKMVEDDNFGYVCDEDPDDFTDWRTYMLQGEVNDGNAFYAHNGVAGHAGLFSNAAEVAALLALVRNGGTYESGQLISASTVEEFLTPTESENGLGWAMNPAVLNTDALPAGSFGHTGFTGTFALSVPAYDLEIVLLTNRQNFGVDETGRYPSVSQLRRDVVNAVLSAME